MGDSEDVRRFFSHWATYRAVIETDSMEHLTIFTAVHDLLAARTTEFAVLDLGCGDAAGIGPALQGTAASRYVGVDSAGPALEFAQANLGGHGIALDLREQDLMDAIDDGEETYEVILISFALHHFPAPDKRRFLDRARRRLAPGGELLLIDVVRRDGQTREEYLARYAELVDQWPMPSATRASIIEHVTANDFPEEAATQPAWAAELGYSSIVEFYAGGNDTQRAWQLVR